MKMKYLLLFLIIFIFTACKKDIEEEVIRAVKIQEINSMQDENFNIDFPAQISPTQKTILAFKYAGKIKSINFESGDFVKKGQVIATMDDKDYKVNLEAFSKKYEAAKAVAQNAETQFTRAEKLYKGEALAKKDYDNALMQKNVAISTFKEASAGLENARNTLNDTKIIAPYDGYIDKKIVEVGTVVPEGGPVISFISNEITDISVNASLKDVEYIKNANDIVFKDILESDLLILDDLGNEYISEEWGKEKLFTFFNMLYENEISVIISTNLDTEQLRKFTDIHGSGKIIDRIKERCKPYAFDWESRRANINKKYFEELY